ncbi:MAG: transketolase C-terminal domain-containing protein [Bacillota bacterium]|nr:transketolase C-terminal domain-containing protein [Bacillota bacterium]
MQWLNQRKAYGESLVKLGHKDSRIVVLEADLGKSTMSCFFQDAFPERYFEMGIAEANMIATAAGLSLTGKIPFAGSFAVFATGRAYDQIRTSICIPALNVKICGSSAGLSDFGDGSTHQSIDDLALMRVLPNMTVLSPVDAVETEKMVMAMAEHDGPVYLRVCRNDLPVLTDPDAPWRIGQITEMLPDGDIALLATGVMVSIGLQAAEQLARAGIHLKVVNISTIKPLDGNRLAEILQNCRAYVTAEEHSVIGGLGSAVHEALSGRLSLPSSMIGIADQFGTSAYDWQELLTHYGLTAEAIVDAATHLDHQTKGN